MSLFILRFFQVLSVLGFFFSEGFWQRALEWESGVLEEFFGPNNALFASRNRRKKSSPFLSIVFGAVLLLRTVSGRVLGHELRLLR